MLLRHASPLFALGLLALSCATYEEPKCRVGADCASGICNADGTCAEPATGSTSSAGGGGSTTSSTTSSSTGTGGSKVCSPNDDGSITRAEVPLASGLHATFLVAQGADFDTAGVKNADGSRTWDLTVPFSGDHKLLLETLPLDDKVWFAKDYYKTLPAPSTWYAAKLSDTNDLLGVFEITDTALLLHGVASQTDSSTGTEMFMNPAVTVLSFPLESGKTWDTLAAVTGKVQGIVIGGIYNEQYTSTVDAHGTLKTPYADLPVMRVHTKLLRYLNGVWMEKHTQSFVAECFGTVGTVVSNDYETSTDFTSTSEIWRFSP